MEVPSPRPRSSPRVLPYRHPNGDVQWGRSSERCRALFLQILLKPACETQKPSFTGTALVAYLALHLQWYSPWLHGAIPLSWNFPKPSNHQRGITSISNNISLVYPWLFLSICTRQCMARSRLFSSSNVQLRKEYKLVYVEKNAVKKV